jgi:hypothetical protein
MRVGWFIPVLMALALSLRGQAQDGSADTPLVLAPESAIIPSPSEPEISAISNGRVLGVIPAHKIIPTTSVAVESLTPGRKFNLAFKDTVDPFTFVSAAFYGGIAQWQNDYPGYGQGAQGYSKRFAAAYSDQAIGNYLTEAIFPILLHDDPRYFRLGVGSKLGRLGYALSRTLITRTDSGMKRFNFSEILGNSTAAGISTLYYPPAQRTIGEVSEKLALQVVGDSVFNVLIEFWPDMRRAIFHKDRNNSEPADR